MTQQDVSLVHTVQQGKKKKVTGRKCRRLLSCTALPMTTARIFRERGSSICDVGCVDAGPLREGDN